MDLNMSFTQILSLISRVTHYMITGAKVGLHQVIKTLTSIARPSYLISRFAVPYLKVLLLDVAHITLFALCIAIIIVILSFTKSLRPRYNFSIDQTHFEDVRGLKQLNLKEQKSRTKPTYTLEAVQKAKYGLIRRLLHKISGLSEETKRQVGPALSTSDIRAVHKQLSWAQTHIDLESVKWLNQTLLSLWPCVKGVLNKYVFNELLKPRTCGLSGYNAKVKSNLVGSYHRVPVEVDKLPKSPTKLSIYISSRRKLEMMRREEKRADRKHLGAIQRGVLNFIVYSFRLFLVYLRQFLMDYIALLIKKPQPHAKEVLDRQIEIDLNRLLLHSDAGSDKKSTGGAKSWAGFDFENRRENAPRKVRRKSRSAPGSIAPKNQVRVIMKTSGLVMTDKIRRMRHKLPTLLDKAKQRLNKREVTLEKISLGDTIPTINGIKYLGETSGAFCDKELPHLIPSDETNMRFILELSYETDRKFRLVINGLPVLNRIRLKKISFQSRFMITVNHTVNELNKNLELFKTPDDILFPALNHVQLTVVDVPTFDWELDRPKNIVAKQSPVKSMNKRKSKTSDSSSINPFDLVDLLNNTYLKYIIHSILYVALKWFQPFDVKVGPHFYIKTVC